MKKTIAELERKSVVEYKNHQKSSVCFVLDNIRSMSNVGSVFRTADAFLVSKIYLCGITATPPNKEIEKTALGATQSVDWEYNEETSVVIQNLKDEGWLVVSLEQTLNSVSLDSFDFNSEAKYAFILGNEVFGVEQKVIDLSDFVIEIPQFGTKHSLNVSVSAGILIWDYYSKTKL